MSGFDFQNRSIGSDLFEEIRINISGFLDQIGTSDANFQIKMESNLHTHQGSDSN